MDESEAAPNIPLVLDEELDAMKIKISQIKSDIQREKVRGAGVRGWTRLALQLRGQQHLPAGEFCWASDPLQVSGTCWALRAFRAPGVPSDLEPSRIGWGAVAQLSLLQLPRWGASPRWGTRSLRRV